ncbi:hypothetical protein [Candidatus Filomicrobium marinum]|nr:hypothetical protein [Candidatus Filomicrobium marinum]
MRLSSDDQIMKGMGEKQATTPAGCITLLSRQTQIRHPTRFSDY